MHRTAIALTCFWLSAVAPATEEKGAQESTAISPNDTLFQDTAGALRCPTCTGVSVLDSSAPFSEQIKAAVREQVKQGRSKDEILEYFVDRYGPWILREPPKHGVHVLAWIVPALALLVGPIVLWRTAWRRVRPIAGVGAERNEQEVMAEFQARLDAARKRAEGR